MDVSRRRLADALFDEALELAPDERAALLDRRCAGEPELRAEVAELLRLVDDAAPALDDACCPHLLPAAVEGTAIPGPQPGDRIGAWRIVRLLGRGGMGSVFLVERGDGQFTQTAALKLTRAGLDSEQITRRFERERQIVASLSHTGIARLLDGGRTGDGRPYFVMEYVEGRAIDRECDERQLSIDERLVLFERVCRAVQHAHSQLVVHRDVKPSNIIVTADCDVKLLDFGIARILEPAHTGTGESMDVLARLLTPDYASPEQIRGEPVATASDIYQLGLLLSELLTGERTQQVPDGSLATLQQVVCETVAVRPSERAAMASAAICRARRITRRGLVRKLRGDLDTIVGCALRKDAQRRYASVADLVEDIDRARRGLPIRARADSRAYRTGKFIWRHRVAVSAAAAVIVTAIAVTPMVTSERTRAAQEQQRARQVEDVLGHLFTITNQRRMRRAPSAADLVDHATQLVRQELGTQPESQARLLTMLGDVYAALGRYETAIEVLEEVRAERERTLGPDSLEVAHTLLALAQSQHYSGRYADSERSLRRAGAIRVQGLGPDHLATQVIALELGDLLHTRGDLLAADEILEPAVARLRAMSAPPEMLSQAMRDHGNILRDRGELARSEALYRESLAILQTSAADTSNQAAITDVYFARLLVKVRSFDEADAVLARCLHSLRVFYEGEHPMTAFALQNLGFLRTEQGRYAEAEQRFAEARQVALAWLSTEHPLVARIQADQAELARRQGRFDAAVRIARQALAHFARIGLPRHPAAIDLHWALGDALLAAGRSTEAADVLREGLAAAERQYIASDGRVAFARERLARASGQAARNPDSQF